MPKLSALDPAGFALLSDMLETFDRMTGQRIMANGGPTEHETGELRGYRDAFEDVAFAFGFAGRDWLDRVRATVTEPISDRVAQCVKFDIDLEAAWESRRPTPAELAAASREMVRY